MVWMLLPNTLSPLMCLYYVSMYCQKWGSYRLRSFFYSLGKNLRTFSNSLLLQSSNFFESIWTSYTKSFFARAPFMMTDYLLTHILLTPWTGNTELNVKIIFILKVLIFMKKNSIYKFRYTFLSQLILLTQIPSIN